MAHDDGSPFDPAGDDLCPACKHGADNGPCHGHCRTDDNLWHCAARGVVVVDSGAGTVTFEHGVHIDPGPRDLTPVH